jgi:tetratricopeptide (TPR) repeat protein
MVWFLRLNRTGIAIVAVFLTQFSAPWNLLAQLSFSQEELRSLPRTCQAQQFIHDKIEFPITNEVERKHLLTVLGKDVMHYHHFCYGLMLVRRGNIADEPNQRLGLYDEAVRNFDYVVRNAKTSFALLPEVHLQKGLTLQLMSKQSTAAREFFNALRLKPSYTPAYAALIDYYLDLGNPAEARRILVNGLKHAPASKLLQEKRRAIDEMEARKNDWQD